MGNKGLPRHGDNRQLRKVVDAYHQGVVGAAITVIELECGHVRRYRGWLRDIPRRSRCSQCPLVLKAGVR